tara:strand:- start:350 stop:628 length:279 start_codon:yes stop_codon:yes gene_type:complete
MDKDNLKSEINDIIEAEIQNNINDYLEQKQEQEKNQGLGVVGPDEGKELRVRVSQDEVDKIIKEYKRIKKQEKSNITEIKKLGLLDKDGNPI